MVRGNKHFEVSICVENKPSLIWEEKKEAGFSLRQHSHLHYSYGVCVACTLHMD